MLLTALLWNFDPITDFTIGKPPLATCTLLILFWDEVAQALHGTLFLWCLSCSQPPRNTTTPFFWNLSTLNSSVSFVAAWQPALTIMTMPCPREPLKSWPMCYHFLLHTEHSNHFDFEWSLPFCIMKGLLQIRCTLIILRFFYPKDSGLEQLEPYTSIVVLKLFALLPTIIIWPKVLTDRPKSFL